LTLKLKRELKRVGDCRELILKSKLKVDKNPFRSAEVKRKAAILARRRGFASILYTLIFLRLRPRYPPLSCHSALPASRMPELERSAARRRRSAPTQRAAPSLSKHLALPPLPAYRVTRSPPLSQLRPRRNSGRGRGKAFVELGFGRGRSLEMVRAFLPASLCGLARWQ
jgi:hypothetical protein